MDFGALPGEALTGGLAFDVGGAAAGLEDEGEGKLAGWQAEAAHLVVEVDGFGGEDALGVGPNHDVVEERGFNRHCVEQGAGVGEAAPRGEGSEGEEFGKERRVIGEASFGE